MSTKWQFSKCQKQYFTKINRQYSSVISKLQMYIYQHHCFPSCCFFVIDIHYEFGTTTLFTLLYGVWFDDVQIVTANRGINGRVFFITLERKKSIQQIHFDDLTLRI